VTRALGDTHPPGNSYRYQKKKAYKLGSLYLSENEQDNKGQKWAKQEQWRVASGE
jgi:hypothetical protein